MNHCHHHNHHHKKIKVLFIIKERTVYGTKTKCYGLFNSCDFICRKLKLFGIEAKTIQVIDNNCIDREVTKYKPTHCFIEALWVVPEKFEVLSKLHPNVEWIVRLHSMIPFLSTEGVSTKWIREYLELREKKKIKISVSCNNDKLHQHLNLVYKDISYTPNIYFPQSNVEVKPKPEIGHVDKSDDIVNIGCFGALRILKNHLQQAFWAIGFANDLNKTLHFHVNISEHEQKESGPVLKNLRNLFIGTKHKLVEHLWYEHSDFISLVKQMDIGMQISYTETFNIVAADFVRCNVPIIVSEEINWIFPYFQVDPSDEWGVRFSLKLAWFSKKIKLHYLNKLWLWWYNIKSTNQWINYFTKKH